MQAIALALEVDDLGLGEEAIEDGGGRGDVAEEGAPVLGRPVGGDHGGRLLVPANEDLEEVLGGAGPEALHAEVFDHEQVDLGETLDELLALVKGLGLEEVLGEVEGA